MSFSESVVSQAWNRSHGKCGCPHLAHDHGRNPCTRPVSWEAIGREGNGGWQARSTSGKYLDTPSDCEILCWVCYSATPHQAQ
ncbi:MAG: hypothetical protein ABSF74_05000 [Dehalococcoidia bacterium]|jgi:hypothetical protein